MKTYFLRNRTGEVKPITVQAIFVMGFPQDLLGGKSLNQENIRVILDKNPEISGVYPLDENDDEHYHESFGFINEPARDTDLYNLQTEESSTTIRATTYGIADWHMLPSRISGKPLNTQLAWRGWSENDSIRKKSALYV